VAGALDRRLPPRSTFDIVAGLLGGRPTRRGVLAYADNYLIDVKFGIIMDVEASCAIRQAEVGASQTMLVRTQECFGIRPQWLAGDAVLWLSPKPRLARQNARDRAAGHRQIEA